MIAASIAASIATTGGVAALVLKKTGTVKNAGNPQPNNPSQEDPNG
jgi:hypothetical protein